MRLVLEVVCCLFAHRVIPDCRNQAKQTNPLMSGIFRQRHNHCGDALQSSPLKGAFDHLSLSATSFDLDIWEPSSVTIATQSLAQGKMQRKGSICFFTTPEESDIPECFFSVVCASKEGGASSHSDDNLCVGRKRRGFKFDWLRGEFFFLFFFFDTNIMQLG